MHPILEPWAISEPGLQLVLAVWSRGEQFPDVLTRARAERGDKALLNDTGKMEIEGGVAVIPIVGPLMRHADMFSEISGATSYASIRRDLRAALASQDVHSILLRVNSPGGEANGCGELADQIRAADAVKPVTAYAEQACSGGYWLAAAAREIVAAPSAVLGSIGVRCGVMDDAKAQEKLGVRRVEIVSSQSPGKRGTPVDDAVIGRVQAHADALADVFIESVARFRGVSEKKVQRDFGAGDVLVGAAAVSAGLADRLGSFDSTLAALRGASRPSAAQGKNDMQTQKNDAGAELVVKADLDAAQTRVAELEKAQASQAPVLAAVKTLTGKSDPIEQIVELASLQGRLAALPSAEQQRATERANLVTELQRKQVPPTTIQALEAACDAAGGDLAVLRAGAAKLEAPKPYAPATQERNAAAPQASGEPVLTKGIKAQYVRCGITDEAQMLAAEKSRLAGGTQQSESDEDEE